MHRFLHISLLVILFVSTALYQDNRDTQSVIKAMYLYNFATLTNWPSEYKKGDFVIAVYGETNVFGELEKKYKGKPIGSDQKINVKRFSTVNEITRCHIIYVERKYNNYLSKIGTKLKDYSTLIVSDNSPGFEQGVVINFVVKNNKQTYDISKRMATKTNLVVSSKLYELANKVE